MHTYTRKCFAHTHTHTHTHAYMAQPHDWTVFSLGGTLSRRRRRGRPGICLLSRRCCRSITRLYTPSSSSAAKMRVIRCSNFLERVDSTSNRRVMSCNSASQCQLFTEERDCVIQVDVLFGKHELRPRIIPVLKFSS